MSWYFRCFRKEKPHFAKGNFFLVAGWASHESKNWLHDKINVDVLNKVQRQDRQPVHQGEPQAT